MTFDRSARLLVHLRWPVAPPILLTPEATNRLRPYTTRYAETLGAQVFALGGTTDHVHLLLGFSPGKTLIGIDEELRRATQRYMRDVLSAPQFTWEGEGESFVSISPWERDEIVAYITEQEERHTAGDLNPTLEGAAIGAGETAVAAETVPDWLREAMSDNQKRQS